MVKLLACELGSLSRWPWGRHLQEGRGVDRRGVSGRTFFKRLERSWGKNKEAREGAPQAEKKALVSKV